MKRTEDSETRYYIDLDLKTRTIVSWGFDQRATLVKQKAASPFHERIFITRGQYYKIEKNPAVMG